MARDTDHSGGPDADEVLDTLGLSDAEGVKPRRRLPWRRIVVVLGATALIVGGVYTVMSLGDSDGDTSSSNADSEPVFRGAGEDADVESPEPVGLDTTEPAARLFLDAIRAYMDDHDGVAPELGSAEWSDPRAGPVGPDGAAYLDSAELPDGDWVVSPITTVVKPAVVYVKSGVSTFTLQATGVGVSQELDEGSSTWYETTTWDICSLKVDTPEGDLGSCTEEISRTSISPP